MYGHEGVARDITARIKTRLPAQLAYLRTKLTVDAYDLPDPVHVLPYFLPDIDIDGYPAICITELDTPTGLTGAKQVRKGTQYDAYVYRYPFRIFIYLSGQDYGEVELLLKRYITAVRMVILEAEVLTDHDEAYVVFDPSTLSENFDDAMEDDARQILAVGFIGIVTESTEVITRLTSVPGPALDVTGGVSAIDRHTDAPTGTPTEIGGTA